MNNKKYIDKVIDDILYEAIPIAEKEMIDELNKEKIDEFKFSQEHNKKMKRIFNTYKRKIYMGKLVSYSKFVATIFLALAVTASVSIVSVEAWRIKVFNLFIDKKDTHSVITFDEVEGSYYQIQNISFNYIPDGFIPEVKQSEPNSIYIRFKKENKYFSFTLQDVNGSLSIDTEDAEIKNIIINNQEGILSKNKNVVILLWNKDDSIYMLTGNINEKEIIKIGENIKR